MGNICDTIGLTRKEPTKIDNNRIAATKTQDERVRTDSNDEGTIKSPVVAASAAALAISAEAVRVAELKAAYIRKQNEEAAAEAAAKAQMVGPRIRLLPHQHTLFCERKQRVCASVGQFQELEVIALEGFDGPLPPFSWIRIKPQDLHYFEDSYEGLIDPGWYQEIQQEHPLDDDGNPTHGDHEYVLTREDVGCYVGVRYDVVRPAQSATSSPRNHHTTTTATTTTTTTTTAAATVHKTSPHPAAADGIEVTKAAVEPSNTQSSALEQALAEALSHDAVEVVGHDSHHKYEAEQLVEHKFLVLSKHGVVKPGPPRLTTFNITGSMRVGTVATVEVCYIGGYEGLSEYWWMRISPDGERVQVTDPQRVPFPSSAARQHSSAEFATRASFSLSRSLNADVTAAALQRANEASGLGGGPSGPVLMDISHRPPTSSFSTVSTVDESLVDPRMYLLTQDDVGCILKAKCRPMRSDGVEGEIFTSTPSEEVTAD